MPYYVKIGTEKKRFDDIFKACRDFVNAPHSVLGVTNGAPEDDQDVFTHDGVAPAVYTPSFRNLGEVLFEELPGSIKREIDNV